MINGGRSPWPKATVTMTLITVLLFLLVAQATDIRGYVSAQALSVNTTPAIPVNAGLTNTTTVQMFIRGSSTVQIFTLTLPDGTSIEVPYGATLTLKFATNLAAGDRIGTVVTATGAAVLQVISIREVKQ